ncbi:MAG: sigma 54-interacting transcriptional regulator [Desulfovibrio sp.]|nr:sigma 54-interacting transcriptional regulator [Desulfovibrio sp.]
MTPFGAEKDGDQIRLRLRKLLDRLPALVYRCRIEENFNYVLEYASRGSLELIGVPPEELVEAGVNIIERMTHPADLESQKRAVRDSVVAHEPWQIMYRIQLRSGELKWLWDQGEAVYDETGAPVYLEGLLMNVSEQKFLEISLQEENRQLRQKLENSASLGAIIGKSAAMREVYSMIIKAAATDTNVIILGETGSGKDMVAREIHNYSGRKGAYVPVNCGAIPENLLESEFFGHTRGAFTGASESKEGLVGAAHNGTLFLDEIGELPLNLQVKFLRVLESKTYTPLGSRAPKTSRFRLVAATNRDLAKMVRDKTLRADLYYRINVLTIHVPPLRERAEDIPLLVEAWQERNGIDLNLPHSVRVAMSHYPWPGNVRELHNFLDRYAVFGQAVARQLGHQDIAPQAQGQDGMTLEEATRELERSLILKTLDQHRWHRGKTATALGLNLRTLQRKMKSLGIA